MSLILSGSDGVSDIDGTAATPAIRGTDANTGIFFPAADTIAFAEGGAEIARFDSSGRLLIGTTSGTRKLTVYENASQVDISIVSSTTGVAVIQMGDTAADNQGQIIYRNSTDAMEFGVNGAERMRIDSSGNLLFNSGYGSVATAYGCRAWVNFNGSGGASIRASGNVSSVTYNGTGDYTINFTTALADANYAYVGTGRRNDGTQRPINFSQSTNAIYNPSTTALRFVTYVEAAAALEDALTFNVAIFR